MKDIKIKIIDREGVEHIAEIPADMGLNVMEVCKSLELEVEGICGGMALCASCQCYVESNHVLQEPSNDEELMLDQAFYVQDNSRLGCQLKISEDLDGLIVRIAPKSESED